MFGVVIDCEANSLTPDRFHVLSYDDGSGMKSTPDYGEMRRIMTESPIVVLHNGARWDIPNLERVLEFEVPRETLVVDTLAISWYLNPKRPNHRLEEYGEEFGIKKPEIDDWENLDYEEYRWRCEQDVEITKILWKTQYEKLLELYGDDDSIKSFLRYLSFKMRCARLQEESRWLLDQDLCKTTLERFEKERNEREDELRGVLPRIPIETVYKKPQKPYRADGSLSEHGSRWIERCREAGVSPDDRESVTLITGHDDPNPGSNQQIKDWLFSLGWKPRTFKENKSGVEVPQINKLKQDGGGLCESVSELIEDNPEVALLADYFVLGHRASILRGFLRDVSEDGYLTAGVSGFTNTLRFKHSELVNLPKTDARLAQEIRGCLIAPEGHELCGSDMSSLEDRTKQHYMFPYDPDYVKEMNTEDFDPHLDIAVVGKLMSEADAKFYKSFNPTTASETAHKEYKRLKTIRGIAKNTNYAAVYGAGAPKVAKTAGIPVSKASTILKAYWNRNWSVKAVAAAQEVKTLKDGSTWLYNPVSTFWYSLRSEKDRFSTLNQSTGVFCFDVWLMFIEKVRPEFTGQFHDEVILTVKKGFREQVTELLRDALRKTNEFLGLNRELGIDVQFGSNYGQIH